jgi:hypothetical protein
VSRRAPGRRLALTIAALTSLILGYYLGQYWQRKPLADLSAVVYPAGRKIDYPEMLGVGASDDVWRLFLVADTRVGQCRQALRHFAMVVNRLAAWPKVQGRLHLAVLAYNRPDAGAAAEFTGGAAWVELISGDTDDLDRLSGQLGIAPGGLDWCESYQANTVLVAPDQTAWALIPYEQAGIMAHNIRSIVTFVD